MEAFDTDFGTLPPAPSSKFELLIDATSCGVTSKRRFESETQDLNDLMGEICFDLNIAPKSEVRVLEVWDNEFEEWVLLTYISKQISGKAKVRILVQQPEGKVTSQKNSSGLNSKTILPPNAPFSDLQQVQPSSKPKKSGRIQVDNYSVNFGLDLKFQEDPDQGLSPKNLHGMLTKQEFRTAIAKINEEIAGSRATNVDLGLLAAGTMILPLIPFGIRNYRHKKNYKKHLLSAINEFNFQHPKLQMKWLKNPISQLVIDWAEEEEEIGEVNSSADINVSQEDKGVFQSDSVSTNTKQQEQTGESGGLWNLLDN